MRVQSRRAERLLRDRETCGQLAESFVVAEIRRLASATSGRPRLFHFRTHEGHEVDLVIESRGHGVIGVEVKAGSTVRTSDFKGLRTLANACGSKFIAGIVLHDGERLRGFGENLWALPYSALWSD
jgi:uncharacterized protein